MADIAELDTQEGSRPHDPAIVDALNEGRPEARPPVAACASPPFTLLLGGALLALVFGMIGACLSLNLFENSSQAAVSHRSPEAATHSDSDPGARTFRTQLTALGRRLEGLKEKIDSLPHADPAPGLAALQSQVVDLNRSAGEVAALPKHVERVDSRLDQVGRDLELLHHEVVLLQSKLGADDPVAAPTALPIVEAPPTEPVNLALPTIAAAAPEEPLLIEDEPANQTHENEESDWDHGIALFKKKKYKDAFEVFGKLEQSRPDDARVWYYAALSQGFATHHWTDSTERLVEKGVERERAGTPKTAAIDEAFRSLTAVTGKDWLTAYRARAKSQ